jgi:hypothetical protein
MYRYIRTGLMLAMLAALLGACNPTVTIAPSDKPITINMNIKIEHEIRIKVDKELEDVLSEDSGLF